MLVIFQNTNGRNIHINAEKVKYIGEGTNGTVIYFDDGTDVLVRQNDYTVSTKLNEALSGYTVKGGE